VDDALLAAAIRRRQRAGGVSETLHYAQRLTSEADEREELLEEILNPESWFFRDGRPFDLLAELARVRWQGKTASGPLRVLSAPCANGEEPYSIALALAGAGWSLSSVAIDAIDLSRRALARARTGIYSEKSVRLVPPALATRYFTKVAANAYEIAPAVRASVCLHHENLLAAPTIAKGITYHAIFTRNLLIYLSPAARSTILTHLRGLLKPDGVLFVGHAEAGLVRGLDLQREGDAAAFAFSACGPASSAAPAAVSKRKAPAQRRVRPGMCAVRTTGTAPQSASPRFAEDANALAGIRDLADRGRYADALQRLSGLLERCPEDAEAHYLSGLIHAASDAPTEARRAFTRALYLHPDHEASLEHLALLLEADDDVAAAQRMRARARRARSKK
jgi:chemotaxis protein methyltransferase WspC